MPRRLPGSSKRAAWNEPFRGSLIGRDEDLAAVESKMRNGARLVTLVGMGGVGKTRLLHRLLSQMAGHYGSVLFCDLTSARTSDDVVSAVGTTLLGIAFGASSNQRQVRKRIARALTRRGACLVGLDNLEQVDIAAYSLIAEWLTASPPLAVVATSRVRLGLSGEFVHRVEPLSTAPLAMKLFEDRAAAVRGPLDEAERASAERIVNLLEGLPLAIEMAAARLRLSTPSELLEHLRRPLGTLSTSTRSDQTADRHASMSRVLDGGTFLRTSIDACSRTHPSSPPASRSRRFVRLRCTTATSPPRSSVWWTARSCGGYRAGPRERAMPRTKSCASMAATASPRVGKLKRFDGRMLDTLPTGVRGPWRSSTPRRRKNPFWIS